MIGSKTIILKYQKLSRIKENVIFQNFSYLSFIQLLAVMVPLITYSYMIRTLGKENYGLIAFGTSIINYITIIINFGFNITATKNVSLYRKDKSKLSLIVSSTFLIKLFLFGGCYILFFIILLFSSLKTHLYFFLLMALLGINDFAQPVWFYQGMEKLFNVSAVSLFNKIFFMLLMFYFIKTQSDYLLVPIIQVIGTVLCIMWVYYDLVVKRKIVIYIPNSKYVISYLKESIPFFTSRLSGVLTFESNSVLIGVLLGYKQVAVYDLAKKIINMLLIPFSILNDAIYPNVVRSKNMVLMKKILVGVTYTALIIYVILQVFSSQIIELLAGKELMDAKILLAYLGCLIPLNAITYFLGNTVLVVMNKHKEFNVSVILSFFAYTLLSVILISLNIWNTVIAAIILTVSIIIQSSYRYYSVRKYKLL